MTNHEPGDVIGIPCTASKGAFPDELLVSFDSMDGPVSGFVSADQIEGGDSSNTFLRAVVEKVAADCLTVRVQGSFFTTTGLAHLRPDTAIATVTTN